MSSSNEDQVQQKIKNGPHFKIKIKNKKIKIKNKLHNKPRRKVLLVSYFTPIWKLRPREDK